MVQGRSLLAGIVGIGCAIAVLTLMALSQAGLATYNTSSGTSSVPAENLIGQNNTTPSLGASFGASFAPASPQAVDSPTAIFSVALLAGIAILISAGTALIVSRRLG